MKRPEAAELFFGVYAQKKNKAKSQMYMYPLNLASKGGGTQAAREPPKKAWRGAPKRGWGIENAVAVLLVGFWHAGGDFTAPASWC